MIFCLSYTVHFLPLELHVRLWDSRLDSAWMSAPVIHFALSDPAWNLLSDDGQLYKVAIPPRLCFRLPSLFHHGRVSSGQEKKQEKHEKNPTSHASIPDVWSCMSHHYRASWAFVESDHARRSRPRPRRSGLVTEGSRVETRWGNDKQQTPM